MLAHAVNIRRILLGFAVTRRKQRRVNSVCRALNHRMMCMFPKGVILWWRTMCIILFCFTYAALTLPTVPAHVEALPEPRTSRVEVTVFMYTECNRLVTWDNLKIC